MVIMRLSYGSVLVLGALGVGGACGGSGRPCEETFTCGRAAGSAGSAGSAGHGPGGRGGSAGSAGGTKNGSVGGKAGGSVGGEGGESGDAASGGTSGSAGKGGGKGSGGASGAPDGAPPEVVSVSPPDRATAAEPDGDIVLRFSEPLDGDTVTNDTITLLDDGAELEKTIDSSGDKVTVTPVDRLSLLAKYTVNAAPSISDLDGTPMAADFSSTFSVRDGVWSEPGQLSDDSTALVSLGVDGMGNVLVGWSSDTGTYARWHRPGSGWESPFTLDDCTTCSSGQVKVAVNDAGDAVAVYDTETGRGSRLYRGGAWGAEAVMASDGVVAVAMAPTGEAHFITDPSGDPISEHTDANDDWVASGYNWSTVDDPNFFPFSFAFDAAGNGFAVWKNDDLGLRFSRYNRGQGTWGSPGTIAGSTIAAQQVLAVSPDGGALVAWIDVQSGQQNQVMASTFSSASGWSAPQPIDGLDTFADGVAAAWGGTGFTVAWRQDNGVDATNVYSNRFDGASWDGPTLRSDGISSTTPTYPLALSGDPHGNLLLVWRTDTGVWDVVTYTRYRAATDDWTPAAPLVSGRTTLYGYPPEALAVGANGVAAVGFTGGDEMGTPTGAEVSFFE